MLDEYEEDLRNHRYALRLRDANEIHISQAERGKGYHCIGCRRDMQAVIPRVERIQAYFRHEVKDATNQERCTFSDEVYRKKLAITFLQSQKRIKVPAIYKLPPVGTDGLAMLVSASEIIEAHHVSAGESFYEDDDGRTLHDKNPPTSAIILFKPDLIFYNEDNDPILCIEIVKKHNTNPEKLAILNRLAINSIQVTIPKDSAESIYKSLLQTTKTKWSYNYEQQHAEYVSFSGGYREGDEPTDDIQRRLFEESFLCRKAQINNLIRRINRCLQSESYHKIEEELRSELGRVNRDIAEDSKRWSELEKRHGEELEREYYDRFTEIATQEDEFNGEETSFERYKADLERRYREKDNALRKEEGRVEDELRKQIEALGGEGKSIKQRQEELERETERFCQDTERETEGIRDSIDKEKSSIESIRRQIDGLPERFRGLQDWEAKLSNRSEKLAKGEIARIEKDGNHLPKRFEDEEERIRNEFAELRERIIIIIKNRDSSGNTELSRTIKTILSSRRIFDDIRKAQLTYNRVRTAWECFKEGAYKNWI
jgi:hypothetical protein